MDMTRCSLDKFLVVPTFVTRRLNICKAGRDPSGERWNYLSRIFHKWPLSRHLGNCFWISEPVLVRTKYFVSVCSTYWLSMPCMRVDHDSFQVMKFIHMRTTCSLALHNMGKNWNCTYWSNWYIYSFVFIPYMCWIWVRNIWLYV